MAVGQDLVDEACAGLGVTEVEALKDGGQKTVRLVARGDERLVLKVIQTGTSSPGALQRAAREVALLESLDSPHVVRVASDLLELGDPPRGAAWLEEFLSGSDLTDSLGEPWPWAEAATMMYQVSLGLAEMHDERVIHRDLSPANIRRLDSDRYVVMDPGYARHELLTPITVLGHPGTYGYISPEHLQQPPAGPTLFSDIFCVGILGYTALVGDPPVLYDGDVEDYANRLIAVSYTPLASLRSDLPADLLVLIDRCLHRQPARRYPHARVVAKALEQLL